MAWIPLLVGIACVGGCNILAYPLSLLTPRTPMTTVRAEFDGLRGKTVAVVVYADMDILYEYPDVREELILMMNRELETSVKGVRAIDGRRIVRYQDGNSQWRSMPVPELGRALDADYVLYVSLNEFSTRQRGSINLARGRAGAQVSVWDTRPVLAGMDACVWQKANVAVTQGGPAGQLTADHRALRLATQREFARTVVKSFHDHKVPRIP